MSFRRIVLIVLVSLHCLGYCNIKMKSKLIVCMCYKPLIRGQLACPFDLALHILTLARNMVNSKQENPYAKDIIAIMTERI